jgi:excisionase family DNA binding protein
MVTDQLLNFTNDGPQQTSDLAQDVIMLSEAADLLRCHPKTLKKMATTGQIPSRRVGSHWRFSRIVLTRWIQVAA